MKQKQSNTINPKRNNYGEIGCALEVKQEMGGCYKRWEREGNAELGPKQSMAGASTVYADKVATK